MAFNDHRDVPIGVALLLSSDALRPPGAAIFRPEEDERRGTGRNETRQMADIGQRRRSCHDQDQLHSKSLRNRDLLPGERVAGSCSASARCVLSHVVSSSASVNTISSSVSIT